MEIDNQFFDKKALTSIKLDQSIVDKHQNSLIINLNAMELDEPTDSKNQQTEFSVSNEQLDDYNPQESSQTPILNKEEIQLNNQNTLIFLDFDDTIFPTTWFLSLGLTIDSTYEEIKPYTKLFNDFEEHVITFLTALLTQGDVHIVTNSIDIWFNAIVNKYLPRLKEYFKYLTIIHSRMLYEHHNVNCPMTWKKVAFEKQIEMSRAWFGNRYNIISIGDSNDERRAIMLATSIMPHSYVKCIKMIGRPTIIDLRKELGSIVKSIEKVCVIKKSLNIELFPRNT
jgi:hypothetical protein